MWTRCSIRSILGASVENQRVKHEARRFRNSESSSHASALQPFIQVDGRATSESMKEVESKGRVGDKSPNLRPTKVPRIHHHERGLVDAKEFEGVERRVEPQGGNGGSMGEFLGISRRVSGRQYLDAKILPRKVLLKFEREPERPKYVRLLLQRKEKQLFDWLLEFAKAEYPQTELRASGGWVRDKLLERWENVGYLPYESSSPVDGIEEPNHNFYDVEPDFGASACDIDIALSNVGGREFTERLNTWLLKVKHQAQKGIGIIQANPEKSKHLETATMMINGISVDFVNLRSELYGNPDSRVPTEMRMGTPSQDAFRRDFTCNALFLNLSTGCIEDWTGKGLEDLQDKLLRTPLSPETTFRDDPLRLLRGIRFSSCLNFRLHEDILAADSWHGPPNFSVYLSYGSSSEGFRTFDDEVEISKPRIQQELSKMLQKGPPLQGLKLLVEKTVIADVLFCFPASDSPCEIYYLEISADCPAECSCCLCRGTVPSDWLEHGLARLERLERLNEGLRSQTGGSGTASSLASGVFDRLTISERLKEALTLAAFTYSLADYTTNWKIKATKAVNVGLVSFLLLRGMRASKKLSQTVVKLQEGAQVFLRMFKALEAKDYHAVCKIICDLTRVDALIFPEDDPEWVLDDFVAASFGLVIRHVGLDWEPVLLLLACCDELAMQTSIAIKRRIEVKSFHRALTIKPLYNGAQLASQLQNVDGGATVKRLLDLQFQLQMAKPQLDRTDLLYLMKKFHNRYPSKGQPKLLRAVPC